ncbi:MAG TPA: glycosyltransferase [Candidatus Limnocylindrales bacterium]|nr:glycosyltransferase [Candidatus Limnocylindrales bacterium]
MSRALRVCFVTANTFEYDSRTLRAARSLAADGHEVVVVAQPGVGLASAETLAGGIRVVRPEIDRRISSAFLVQPPALRRPVRLVVSRLLALDPEATALAPRGAGPLEAIRAPLRRAAEILAYRRRVEPWARAVVAAAPADIYSAKALVALPVVRLAADRSGGRFVYDVADLHIESGRLSRLPKPIKAYLYRRERTWMADAAALIAVTDPLADEVVRRFHVERPVAVMNCRARWHPDEPGPPASTRLRTALAAVAQEARLDGPIVLYQGAFREDQGIEELLDAFALAPLRTLPLTAVFLGFGRLEPRLRAAAAAEPGRIVVLPPVPSEELLAWTAGADVAFVGTPPKTVNQRFTIPNKLFESLMAGVPVVVAAGTAVAALVDGARVGTVVTPWTAQALADAMAAMLTLPADERWALRVRARTAALDRYNAETEQARLVDLYRRLAAAS